MGQALMMGLVLSTTAVAQRPSSQTDTKAFAAFLMMVEEDLEAEPTDQPKDSADPKESAAVSEQDTLPGPTELVPAPVTPSDRDLKEIPTLQPMLSEPLGINESAPLPGDEDYLVLSDVIASVYRAYPEIEQARLLLPLASGELLSAWGAYDTKFKAESLSEPTGFYENYRNSLGLARQLWWGGYVSAGYRIGRGRYQPWYLERQTEDAGEFKVSLVQPLLRGRAIDPQRVAVFQASLRQQAAGPQLQATILAISAEAVRLYWEWVSAGAVVEAQRELLELATERRGQIQALVDSGRGEAVDIVINDAEIANRTAAVLKAEQKFRSSAFKLGLFLRDAQGEPLFPKEAWVPERFPRIDQMPQIDLNSELASALSRRPEPQILQLEQREVQWDRQLARNDFLPQFDLIAEASQDMGEQATKSDDKGELVTVLGFQSEVPIQRRKAIGKIQQTTAKIGSIQQKLRLVRNKIQADLFNAYNQLVLAENVVIQSKDALISALDVLRKFRAAFEAGRLELVILNLQETKVTETEIKLIEAQRDWFVALGELQLALGLDPLDQAIMLSELPLSDMPGPGNLPEAEE